MKRLIAALIICEILFQRSFSAFKKRTNLLIDWINIPAASRFTSYKTAKNGDFQENNFHRKGTQEWKFINANVIGGI